MKHTIKIKRLGKKKIHTLDIKLETKINTLRDLISEVAKVGLTEGIENALLAFEDGLFVIFINEREIKALDDTIYLSDESEIVFLKLTFLTGGFY